MNICDFLNAHKGRPGVVLGAGPSLEYLDKSILDKSVCIGVNSSILFSSDIPYWVSDDIAVCNWSYFYNQLKFSKCIKFMYRSKLSSFEKHFGLDKTVLFDHDWWYEPSSGRKNMDGVIIRRNSCEKLIGARTSSGTAIHILALMGCDPILLTGMDNGVRNGKRYFWESDKSIKRLDGRPVRGGWDAFDYNGVTQYFNDLYLMNKDNINIMDATPGNPMNIFPGCDIMDILS